ncbi:MAG: shikimate dehydrogenase [Chitinispirillales bacterium]|jgi:shikimate dehydrogenase|nr:shikimate dehydrogenase [Chitinispirillales bacterium]
METRITGAAKSVCLLGDPVAHSISPQIHNRAFEALGLPYVYIPLRVEPRSLHSAIHTLRFGMAGANVTIPHKERALRFCDEISELSAAAGAVNTLYLKNGRLCGTTTDPAGFYRALEAAGRVLDGGDDAVILGSGGTARTLGAALLLDKKCRSLVIAARSVDKAEALALSIKGLGKAPVSGVKTGSPQSAELLGKCTLLVNCTSVGMHPNVDDTPLDRSFFNSGMTVFDAVYNPGETRFLREAAAAGCVARNGLLMLLHQGLESFRYWTGVDAPADIFDEAWLRSLVCND